MVYVFATSVNLFGKISCLWHFSLNVSGALYCLWANISNGTDIALAEAVNIKKLIPSLVES